MEGKVYVMPPIPQGCAVEGGADPFGRHALALRVVPFDVSEYMEGDGVPEAHKRDWPVI